MSERITVVVSVYNMEKYLHRCMNSLLEQTYKEYEIILVDDGSTDSSQRLCDSYAQKYSNKVKCIHKKNGGLSSARNCGIEAANSRYVIFPDPDDWVEPDYLQRFIEAQKIHPSALICCGYVVEFEEQRNAIVENGKTIAYCREQAQLHLLKSTKINGFAWNKLYDIQVIRAYNLRFLDDVGTKEDLDFAFRYMEHIDSVVHAAEYATYHYLQRIGSATWSGYTQKRFDGLRVYEKMIAANPDDSVLIREAKSCICSASLNLIAMYIKDGIENPCQWEILACNIRNNWKNVFFSSSCSLKRKLAALAAQFNPHLVKYFYR